MTVLSSLEVDWTSQVELLDNDTWAEIEVLVDDLDELGRGLIGGTVGINVDGEWLRDTNGV